MLPNMTLNGKDIDIDELMLQLEAKNVVEAKRAVRENHQFKDLL
jgi:hypothetical protein